MANGDIPKAPKGQSSVYDGRKNRYDLIDSARDLLEDAKSHIEDPKHSPLSKRDKIEAWGITGLSTRATKFFKEQGLYYVTITPDFYSCRNLIRLDPYKIYATSKDAADRSFREILKSEPARAPSWIKGRSKFAPKSSITKTVERMVEMHTMRKYGTKIPLGRWRIEVGITNPYAIHRGVVGNRPVRYNILIPILLSLGYDPLLPLRKGKLLDSVRIEMAKAIINAINEGRTGKAMDIKGRLSAIGIRTVDRVREYIHSGEKPALASKTVVNRRWRRSHSTGLYQDGIYEPLSESGQLANAISFRVAGENAWFKAENKVEEDKKNAKSDAVEIGKSVANGVVEAKKKAEEMAKREAKEVRNSKRTRAYGTREGLGGRTKVVQRIVDALYGKRIKNVAKRFRTTEDEAATIVASQDNEALAIQHSQLLKESGISERQKQNEAYKKLLNTNLGIFGNLVARFGGGDPSKVPKKALGIKILSTELKTLQDAGITESFPGMFHGLDTTYSDIVNAIKTSHAFLAARGREISEESDELRGGINPKW